MHSSHTYIADSLRDFNEKKELCLSYIDEARKLLEEYEAQFPAIRSENPELGMDFGPISLQHVDNIKGKIQNEMLKILVAGQFKAGKSTLINAILGDEVLPAFSTPCTAVITEILYGENKKAIIHFKKNIEHIPDDLNSAVKQHIKKYNGNPPPIEVSDENFEIALEDYLVIPISEKEQEDSVAESPYALCELFWPLDLCKHGALIIDSPGLNEAEARDITTMNYVEKADLVLHVLSSQQCYGQPDKNFVHFLENIQGIPKIFAVNRFDQLNSDREKERLRQYALDKLLPHATYGNNSIFFMSAYKALEGRLQNNAALFEESGFSNFERKIGEIFNLERSKIKLGHIKGVFYPLQELALQHIPNKMTLLQEEVGELKDKYKSKEHEFEKLNMRKDSIGRKIVNGCKHFEKSIQIEFMNFFQDFTHRKLDEIVEKTSIPEISIMWGKEEDIKKGLNILDDQVKNQLKDALITWQSQVGQKVFADSVAEIKADIQGDLEEFKTDLAMLQKSLNLTAYANDDGESFGIGFDDLGSAFGGAMLGGGLAGGAIFVASRFFAVLGGPVGWAITGVATVASIVWALLDRSKAQEKVKETFLAEVRKGMVEKQSEWIRELTHDCTENFREKMEKVNCEIEKSIQDTKLPIEEAIHLLEQDFGDKELKKSMLKEFKQKFEILSTNGEEIYTSL